MQCADAGIPTKRESVSCYIWSNQGIPTKPNSPVRTAIEAGSIFIPSMEFEKSNISRAEEIKILANEAFKAHKFSQAIVLYTQAIELNSQNPVYWANRAFAHTKLEEYGSAIQDASKAIEIDPKYSKGYYRRGAAYLAMGKFKEALKDFQQVKKICPNDPDAAKKLRECEKAVLKLKFEEAISVPESERHSVADSIDYQSIEVESQYSGARIEGDVVTLDFVKKMMDDFKNQKCLHKRYAFQIVLQTREMLRALPSLVDINIPNGKHFTVCGDVHGQFYDLLNIFELNGLPSEDNPYLFNGDFVDRGSFSLEVILTLFAFKCMSPSAIYLSRGNHESKSMNKIYGFEGEVRSKLSEIFVELFAEVFCCLPLAHALNEKVFIVHGGLFSVDGVKLSDIRAIDRFCEPPEEGLMCELLWSDPQPQPGRGPSKRGVGLSFGADVTKRFLQENNLDLVVRSHEVKDEGYEIEHDGKLITVFSAPNYCDQMGNKGAFIRFEAPDLKPNIVTFSSVPHPDVKPMAYANNFLRMFSQVHILGTHGSNYCLETQFDCPKIVSPTPRQLLLLSKMDLHATNPGPIDDSVLYDQDKHVSSAVWEGQERGALRCHEHTSKLDQWTLTLKQVELVKKAGFGYLRLIPAISLDNPLISALVERWRRETNTFHFTVGEMTVTLEDVAYLIGLRIDGEPVIGVTYTTCEAVCLKFLGKAPDSGALGNASLKAQSTISGCLTLLQCWSYYHLNVGRPRLNHDPIHESFPFVLRWKGKQSGPTANRDVAFYRKALDTLKPSDVEWSPYTDISQNVIPEEIKQNLNLGRSKTMLICFDKAERHLPDRCLRQYGMQQLIPEDVLRWERKSRGVDGGIDLSGKMESELSEWFGRRLNIVEGDEAIDDSEYMQWYSRITRKLVGRPIPISSEFQRMNAMLRDIAHLADTLSTHGMDEQQIYSVTRIRYIVHECLRDQVGSSTIMVNLENELVKRVRKKERVRRKGTGKRKRKDDSEQCNVAEEDAQSQLCVTAVVLEAVAVDKSELHNVGDEVENSQLCVPATGGHDVRPCDDPTSVVDDSQLCHMASEVDESHFQHSADEVDHNQQCSSQPSHAAIEAVSDVAHITC
ncbi:hypothetical protein Vadar_024351 [Vaccinium darrowii]|uniref:Uncharacterized protein n=1 Tax=Vaccinium darrowii TaxID=229202 RepID=A0ACB7Z696_9ERIC|nr:hypothetical protein Vadar_024351 [Vaccinium darrowii]